jgi:calcium-dependent protein kinase
MSRRLLTEAETDEIRRVFTKLDLNGDGSLSREEIQAGFLSHYKMSEDELEDILAVCDADGNGVIDYSEFITAAVNRDSVLGEEKLRQAFQLFDMDSGGTIVIEEL